MTFKWPTPPTSRAPIHDLADYVEMICWRDGEVSLTEITRLATRQEDVDYSGGVGNEDEFEGPLQDTFDEIQYRLASCDHAYPFQSSFHGQTLRPIYDPENVGHSVYKFLLLATRLDMRADRQRFQDGLDGTRIFEQISADVAKEYLGVGAESLVFGEQSGSSGFGQKVNDLCRQLNEGLGYRSSPPSSRISSNSPNDGKLDVVTWKPFRDNLPGKLIGFGQCKTGTSYKNTLTQLQPGAFRDKWMKGPIAVPPIRMFFVAEALSTDPHERSNMSIDGGLTFDRCRIAEFSAEVEQEVVTDLERWTNAAASANGLPLQPCSPLQVH